MTPHVETPVQAKEATETPVGNGEAMPKTAPPSARERTVSVRRRKPDFP